MTLEQIFYLSQSIASVAVIGTLIYLGVQIRDTERNQRAIMQQGRADRVTQTTLALASSPQLTALWSRLFAPNPEFTPDELSHIMLIWRVAFISGEDSFLQHRSGALDDAAFNSFTSGVRLFMQSPGMRAGWRLSAAQYGAEYRAWMEAMVSEAVRAAPVDSAAPVDTHAQWLRLLREELARQTAGSAAGQSTVAAGTHSDRTVAAAS
jgi:hypothetical protein